MARNNNRRKNDNNAADDESRVRVSERKQRGGSMSQTTPPQIPDRSHRYHGELAGVGCWITRFSEFK